MKTDWATVGLVTLASGFAGFAAENALFCSHGAPANTCPLRHSANAPNLPFLPVYAVGGAAVALLAPHLADLHPVGKALVYAGALTAVEAAAGYGERAMGRESWDYGGSPVDLSHAALWGALGLGLDKLLRL